MGSDLSHPGLEEFTDLAGGLLRVVQRLLVCDVLLRHARSVVDYNRYRTHVQSAVSRQDHLRIRSGQISLWTRLDQIRFIVDRLINRHSTHARATEMSDLISQRLVPPNLTSLCFVVRLDQAHEATWTFVKLV